MPAKQKPQLLTTDDLNAQGYTLFPCPACVGPKDLDIWERESHHGEGWQYLVSFSSPARGMRVLNADAPLDRVPDVGTLADMLLDAKVLRKRPDLGFEWAINLNSTNDFPGNFSAECFRDRAVAELILHDNLTDDDDITTFTIEADGTQDEDDAEYWGPKDWLESFLESANDEVLGPLKHAIVCNDLVRVLAVLKENRDPARHSEAKGPNSLHFCAWLGREAIVPALVGAGHNPDAVNAQGNTPMHVAASRGHDAVCVALYKNGANPMAFNALGQTPMAMAEASGQADTLHHLRTIGASMVARAALHEMLAPPSPAFKP